MNIIWLLHWIFPLSVILMPLLPVRILCKVLWYPIIYQIIWVLFDGCPLNKYTPIDNVNPDKDNFLVPILRQYVNKDLSQFQCECIMNLVITLSITLSAYKIIFKRK
jgi:hypothetical protein